MYDKTYLKESPPSYLRGLLRPERRKIDGTLSRQDLRRIVAEILG